MESQADPRVKALFTASRRFGRLQMQPAAMAGKLELRPSEIFLLIHLKKASAGEGLKPSELADRLGVTAGNITQLITTLEERGLVSRAPDAQDRRVVRVCLTAAGAQAMTRAKAALDSAFSGLVKELGGEESDRLTALLERSCEYFDRLNGGACPAHFGRSHHGPA